MKHFTDMMESLLSKTTDKMKYAANDIKTKKMMSDLTLWMSVLWEKSGLTGKDTDVLGKKLKYGDIVAMIDYDHWDTSFGILIDEPDNTGKCRVFQWGAEDWEAEDPFMDTMCVTPMSNKLIILARKEDGVEMIKLLINVKKK